MKKLLIVVGAVLALIVLLIVVALVTIKPDELINARKDEVAKTISDTLGREVRLGKVESFFYPSIGAVVRDVALAGPEGAAQDQMSLQAMELKVALLPALLPASFHIPGRMRGLRPADPSRESARYRPRSWPVPTRYVALSRFPASHMPAAFSSLRR